MRLANNFELWEKSVTACARFVTGSLKGEAMILELWLYASK
jgi:hypothetical protein